MGLDSGEGPTFARLRLSARSLRSGNQTPPADDHPSIILPSILSHPPDATKGDDYAVPEPGRRTVSELGEGRGTVRALHPVAKCST